MLLRSCLVVLCALMLTGCATTRNDDSGKSRALAVDAMTFNVRFGTAGDGPDAWPLRRDALLAWLASKQPGVLGVQEALHFQIEELAAALPGYGWAGAGRDDGRERGEYAAILFDRDRFELLESDTFWFSDSPQTPGSTSWGNRITRICSWVRLRDRHNGGHFYVYNLHLDHESQPSRERSIELLLRRIEARSHADAPVLVLGDFNAGESNPASLALRDAGYVDTFRVLHPGERTVGTFNAFSGTTDGEKIDHIFIRADAGWTVRDARIHRDTTPQGRNLSDHFAVSADLFCPAE